MIVEIGHFALVLALAVALVQSIVPYLGARRRDAALLAVAEPAALAQAALVAIAFAALVTAYVRSDFSVVNVWENSHSAKPLLYKVTGVWGNHEGSMLLWVLILAVFGAMVALFGRALPATLRGTVLAVQAWIAVAFLLFVLGTSNPFERIASPPLEGRDLNPILQDLGLAIHPPLLYLGYVGLSISFAFAVAALIEGRVDAAWARWVRPWTLAAWVFLTLGIAMGSYWAYYELGWGGWWFWDPVENASFMPWLAATALLHSALVMEKREALKIWTVLLAILAFSLSLLGTFLVRSGVLTSVHSFATDPARGVVILAILTVFIGGSLALYAWRAPTLSAGGLFAPISREGALVLNNLFLTAACAAVLVGTLYPLALEAVAGTKISVGAPFFELTFGPLVLPLLLAAPFGPFLAWKRGDLPAAAERLALAFGLALLVTLATWFIVRGGPVLAVLGVGVAAWLMLGALAEIAFRAKLGRVSPAESLRRVAGLPRAAFGTTLAHFGLGVVVLGIAAQAWQVEVIRVVKPGESFEVAGHALTFEGIVPRTGPNYRDRVGVFLVGDPAAPRARLEPAKRSFTTRPTETGEAAIWTSGFSQLYAALGDDQTGGGIAVRVYWKPLVTLIWLGCVVMALGGALSLSDRRLRIGAPRRARVAAASPAE